MHISTFAVMFLSAITGTSAVDSFRFDVWANQVLKTDPTGMTAPQHFEPCYVARLQDTTTGAVLFGPGSTDDSETNCNQFTTEPEWAVPDQKWTDVSCSDPHQFPFGWSFCVSSGTTVRIPPLVDNDGTANCQVVMDSGDTTVGHGSCMMGFS